MAKGSSGHRRIAFRQMRPTPYPLRSCSEDVSDLGTEKCGNALDPKEWEDAMCSVCMEYPHNAVLLLCASHEKGCRPYMCGTSCRYSNCLDQYKKAYTKVTSSRDDSQPLQGVIGNANANARSDESVPFDKSKTSELACPLCRGQVKGWTVVQPAREYLNSKRRNCMQEKCTFVGTYRELRKHVRAEHPTSRPREVDPALEQKWTHLERERERDDVISTIRSTMPPGSMVFGDYVIEGSPYGDDEEDERGFNEEGGEVGFNSNLLNVFLMLHAFGQRRNIVRNDGFDASDHDNDGNANHHVVDVGSEEDDDVGGGSMSLVRRLRQQGTVLLGRSGRRRRRREANRGGGAR